MSNPIHIDIVSDIVCPWCAIGYYRLLAAAKQLGISHQLAINWHPFELNPNMPPEGENLRRHLAAKYGTTLEGSIAARKKLTTLGAEVGFTFNYFDEMKMLNTRKAHTLISLAGEKGIQNQMAEALFSAFFAEAKDISNSTQLVELATTLGLTKNEVQDTLHNQQREQSVIAAERHWLDQGFHAVPVIIIGQKAVLPGAQNIATYASMLHQAIVKAG